MLLFLLLLLLAGAAVAIYASENTSTQSITFLQWHWSGVADWIPVVVAAAVIAALFLLYVIYSGMVHGVRLGSMRRRVSTREQAITDMREENQRLREENGRLRSELRGMDRGVAGTTVTAPDRPMERAGADRAPVATAPDRSRTVSPYRPRATFGERVRAFFSGREPAGY